MGWPLGSLIVDLCESNYIPSLQIQGVCKVGQHFRVSETLDTLYNSLVGVNFKRNYNITSLPVAYLGTIDLFEMLQSANKRLQKRNARATLISNLYCQNATAMQKANYIIFRKSKSNLMASGTCATLRIKSPAQCNKVRSVLGSRSHCYR